MPHRAALLLLAQLWPTAAIRHRSVHVLKALAEGCGTRTLGPVLGGIDIVATYVSARQKVEEPPIMGRPQYNFTNDEGFTFYFSSQVSLDAYAESPESYPVGAGGYCGAGCSGHTARKPGRNPWRVSACRRHAAVARVSVFSREMPAFFITSLVVCRVRSRASWVVPKIRALRSLTGPRLRRIGLDWSRSCRRRVQ